MITRYGASRDELQNLLLNEPRYRVDQVWKGLYTELNAPEDMTALPKALRAQLVDLLPNSLTLVEEVISDDDTTIKFLWQLDGGSRIETVLMIYPDRATVCVSTQAGCAMACGFCATGPHSRYRCCGCPCCGSRLNDAVNRCCRQRDQSAVPSSQCEPGGVPALVCGLGHCGH